jgi:hypothetical protein
MFSALDLVGLILIAKRGSPAPAICRPALTPEPRNIVEVVFPFLVTKLAPYADRQTGNMEN